MHFFFLPLQACWRPHCDGCEGNVCTDYMYIKYICITFTLRVLNVFFFFFSFPCVGPRARCDPLTPPHSYLRAEPERHRR